MNPFFAQLGKLFQRYTSIQRVMIGVVFIGMISAIISLVLWANKPDYDILFSDLEPTVASRIVSELRSQKVKYRLENNGQTIFVPAENASELRLLFAEEGLVGSTVPGYDVFDNQKIGMTSFMQKLNMRRALEGELTKTINQFPGVSNSRVHLVLPEGKLFDDNEQGSASVVLYLKNGRYISAEQVKGIAAMVANSVDGISAENVVVVDTEGNMLTENTDDNAVIGSAGNQWELRTSIESKLRSKVHDIVESVVGAMNAQVEVSVDLDFEQIERTTEAFDPENVSILSEERHSETSVNSDSTSNTNENYTNENVVTNYELNKTVEHFISSKGDISKLSVAVLVNGKHVTKTDPDGNEIKEYVPRTAKELSQIEALVKSAVGFDGDRGDIVEVQNLEFDRSDLELDQKYFKEAEKKEMWAGLINKGFMGVALLIAFLVIRGLLKNYGPLLPLPEPVEPPSELIEGVKGAQQLPAGIEMPPDYELSEDLYIKKLSPEAQAKMKAKDKMTNEVVEYAKSSPEATAKLIRSWLTNQNSRGNTV